MTKVRISAASLVRISIEGKFLMILNKTRKKVGNKVYSLPGGAMEFHKKAESFLSSIGTKFEKKPDIRFVIDEKNLFKFEKWFKSKKDREIKPYRELREELVEEEKILSFLPESAIKLKYLKTIKMKGVTDNPKAKGVLTQWFFEMYWGKLSKKYEDLVKKVLCKPNSNIALISEKEIKNKVTDCGIRIMFPV